MISYLIRIICNQCGESWSEQVEVEEENIQAEAIRLLSRTAKDHRHDVLGQWSVNWQVS